MPLGQTWWHGPLGNPNRSDDGFKPRRDEEAEQLAWEETAVWEGKRWALSREASALLQATGSKVKWDGTLILQEGIEAGHPLIQKAMSDEEFMVFLALVITILSE